MNYKESFEWGRKQLQKSDITEAELDARLLLEYVCDTNRTTLLAHGDREMTEDEFSKYETLITKRKEHIPLQHLTHVQNFMGFDFEVNEHVLIPRQDTEILVEEVMQNLHDGMKILDLCTGSGCILISLLKYSNDCYGMGIDLSEDALEVARKNAMSLGLNMEEDGNICFLKSDLYENVTDKFDLIVSNPPYIESAVVDTLMPEVKDHEPRMALDGYEDGLYFYREIIKHASEYLNRNGQLFFEIGYNQAQAVSKLMEDNNFHEISIKKDYAGLDRVVFGTYY